MGSDYEWRFGDGPDYRPVGMVIAGDRGRGSVSLSMQLMSDLQSPGKDMSAQAIAVLSPADAREIAEHLREAADAAEKREPVLDMALDAP